MPPRSAGESGSRVRKRCVGIWPRGVHVPGQASQAPHAETLQSAGGSTSTVICADGAGVGKSVGAGVGMREGAGVGARGCGVGDAVSWLWMVVMRCLPVVSKGTCTIVVGVGVGDAVGGENYRDTWAKIFGEKLALIIAASHSSANRHSGCAPCGCAAASRGSANSRGPR